jgi:hypothetical protein
MMPPAAFASMVISLVMQRVSRKELKELYRLRNRNGLFALLEKSGDFGNHFLDRGGWKVDAILEIGGGAIRREM